MCHYQANTGEDTRPLKRQPHTKFWISLSSVCCELEMLFFSKHVIDRLTYACLEISQIILCTLWRCHRQCRALLYSQYLLSLDRQALYQLEWIRVDRCLFLTVSSFLSIERALTYAATLLSDHNAGTGTPLLFVLLVSLSTQNLEELIGSALTSNQKKCSDGRNKI